eukprot:c2237_g1_i1.p1 GENE.c2237_g1_i1~~c2237_g1_i1.p1  ORF type:complete len:110 (+),score=21.47 c2237_g1_i1:124-453(+)
MNCSAAGEEAANKDNKVLKDSAIFLLYQTDVSPLSLELTFTTSGWNPNDDRSDRTAQASTGANGTHTLLKTRRCPPTVPSNGDSTPSAHIHTRSRVAFDDAYVHFIRSV